MTYAAVALSSEPDPHRAARTTAEEIRNRLEGRRPDWAVAFVTVDHAHRLNELLSSLSHALDTPYVAGCSASGVLASGREIEGGTALGVLAVASDSIRATPFLFRDDGDRGLTAGVRVGQRLSTSRGTHDLVLVWPDPYHVRPDRLLQGLSATLEGVPVAGGAASSGGTQRDATFQFSGSEWARNAVSGVRLGGAFHHRVGVTQGCRPLGEPLRVTRSHENLVLEVEGRPPLEILRESAPEGWLDDPDWAMNFVFVGLLPDPQDRTVRAGEYLIRNIVAIDPDTGVLAIADSVEEGQSLVFALREGHSAEDDLRRMLSEVTGNGSELDFRFGLYFNCLARGHSLYRREGVDAALLERFLPGVPLLGFFCNAEIAPLRDVNHLFTYTGVLVLVAD